MRFALIFAGEVEVNIGRFVAVEAEEGFKRNFMPVANHIRAAVRAILFRHIKARAVLVVGVEFGIFALRATVVRRQGVHFGNPRHGRHERRADRTTRADMVAVVFGIPHQFLRDDIQNRETVLDNRIEFPV